MTVVLVIAAVVAMVAVSGFLAASETAIGSLSRAELIDLADESPRTGEQIRRIAAAPEAHVGALTFSRVLLETMAAIAVTLLLTDVFEYSWQAFLAAAGIMIVVSFVLTGASPRSVGRAHPAAVLRASAWAARLARTLLGPLALVLVQVGDRVSPGRAVRVGSVTSEEQLLSMVDEAAELDVLEDDDRERIHSVFAFANHIVREVMVPRTDMITIDAGTPVSAAVSAFLDAGISRAPVVGRDGDDVRGVLYFKDLVARHLDAAGGDPAVDTIARPAIFVPETLPADGLLARMQQNATHLAMVVDEYGGIAGLATLEDLIEELVGDISDEYDHEDAALDEVAPGEFRVPSRLPLDELGDLFDLDIDDDDVDTVSGLMGKALGKVPERGDVAVVEGLRLAADRVGRRGRVTTVLARLAPVGDADGSAGDAPGRGEVDAVLDRGFGDDERRTT